MNFKFTREAREAIKAIDTLCEAHGMPLYIDVLMLLVLYDKARQLGVKPSAPQIKLATEVLKLLALYQEKVK